MLTLLTQTLDLIAPRDDEAYKLELARIKRAEKAAKRELAEEKARLHS
jgi:hypothetical protein